MVQAAGKLLRELPAGTAPPLDIAPTRSIYGGPAAAAHAVDAGEEFSTVAASAAIKARSSRVSGIARLLADAEPDSASVSV